MTSSTRYRSANDLLKELGITKPEEIDIEAHRPCTAKQRSRTSGSQDARPRGIVGYDADRAIITVNSPPGSNAGVERAVLRRRMSWLTGCETPVLRFAIPSQPCRLALPQILADRTSKRAPMNTLPAYCWPNEESCSSLTSKGSPDGAIEVQPLAWRLRSAVEATTGSTRRYVVPGRSLRDDQRSAPVSLARGGSRR